MEELMTAEEYQKYEELKDKFYKKCRKILSIITKDEIPVDEFLHFVINGDNVMGMCDNINNYAVFPKRLMLIENETELIDEIARLKIHNIANDTYLL